MELHCKIWEYEFDIEESDGNILNQIFEKKIQGQKHPARLAIAEQKIHSFGKHGSIVQMDRTVNILATVVIIMINYDTDSN